MALPTSGPLTLADIQTEFGGSNPISLNEYYAGGAYVPAATSGTYGAVPSSGEIGIRNFYGTQASLDTQTVTVGTYVVKGITYWGYAASPAFGSIVDGTFNPLSGATIIGLYYLTSSGAVSFALSGVYSNSGWTTLDIGGTSFTRASASFSNSTNTIWTWTASNPFGTTVGATKVCTFS